MQKTKPDDLVATLTTEESGKVRVSPVLLNDGDSITARFLVANFQGVPEISARIAGIRQIRNEREREDRMSDATEWIFRNGGRIAIALGVPATLTTLLSIINESYTLSVIGTALFSIALTLGLLWLIERSVEKLTG